MKTTGFSFVPEDLKDCFLYVLDENLCRRWEELMLAWRVAYPGIDIVAEIKKAHCWEVNNKRRRKRNRPRFLTTWLDRAQDNYRPGRDNGNSMTPDIKGLLIRDLLDQLGAKYQGYEITYAGMWKPGGCVPWSHMDEERLQSILQEVKGA